MKYRLGMTWVLLFSVFFAGSGKNVGQTDVLKEKQGWSIDSIAPGVILYNYSGYYEPQHAIQNVNIIEVDLSVAENALSLVYVTPSDSLSSVAEKNGALAGINGTYEAEASFVKSDGVIHTRNVLKKDHLRFWKHEGALFYNRGTKEISISYGTDSLYEASPFTDIISGAPMLIDNYNPVGERFVGDVSRLNLDSLAYEDYRRHQGVRHPRTAVAIVNTCKLLLTTVDGRHKLASGMSAKELTQFIRRYFDPEYALNIDGGGSTTMWINGCEGEDGVINYPSDNKRYDHVGQRRVSSFLLLDRKHR